MKVSPQSEKVGSQLSPMRPRWAEHRKEQTGGGERTSADDPSIRAKGVRFDERRGREGSLFGEGSPMEMLDNILGQLVKARQAAEDFSKNSETKRL